MATLFTKTDDGTTVTYIGKGDAVGQDYTITKDADNLIVKIVIPNRLISSGKTWQELSTDLDAHI